jgi:putative FmdB family regulatory protein
VVPIYEYECDGGHRFEQLVGTHVGVEEGEVSCPKCGSKSLRRLVSGYSPVSRQLTPRQKRRLEAKRGTDRGGAKQRFKQQRAKERRADLRRRGGKR